MEQDEIDHFGKIIATSNTLAKSEAPMTLESIEHAVFQVKMMQLMSALEDPLTVLVYHPAMQEAADIVVRAKNLPPHRVVKSMMCKQGSLYVLPSSYAAAIELRTPLMDTNQKSGRA